MVGWFCKPRFAVPLVIYTLVLFNKIKEVFLEFNPLLIMVLNYQIVLYDLTKTCWLQPTLCYSHIFIKLVPKASKHIFLNLEQKVCTFLSSWSQILCPLADSFFLFWKTNLFAQNDDLGRELH